MRVRRLLPAAAFCVMLAACGVPPVQPAFAPAQSSTPASRSVSPSASASALDQPQAVSSAPVQASTSPAALPPLPKELIIPAIHVDAPVEQVGTTPDGAMAAPAQWDDVGWYNGGFRPGQSGNSVVAGHLDSTTDRAVFWDLNKLKGGDQVIVKEEDGSQLTFSVVDAAVYPFDQAPLQRIFGPADVPQLNLVTCNGVFDRGSKNYDKRLVVYTKLASS